MNGPKKHFEMADTPVRVEVATDPEHDLRELENLRAREERKQRARVMNQLITLGRGGVNVTMTLLQAASDVARAERTLAETRNRLEYILDQDRSR